MEPLVYIGPAEGRPKAEWKLKSAKELLDLKICDMACGSGAFLVQAARYLAERLMEAWDEAKKVDPNTPGITPEGIVSTGKSNENLIPDDPAERKTYAMRIVAQRCLYGVDKNPLAAEMAKLSLWLLTLAKDKPFEFLDHAIRYGDSLVGLQCLDQLRYFSLRPDTDDPVLFKGPLESAVDEAIRLRLLLEDMPAITAEDVERQERLLIEANERLARVRYSADLLVAAEFWSEGPKDKIDRVSDAAVRSSHFVERGSTEEFERVATKDRRGQSFFHWPLEFPEVMVKHGGFDAFVGNPPFMGGSKISGSIGSAYRDHLVEFIAVGMKGNADLCAYFLMRADQLTKRSVGSFGFLTTNTISQGDTGEVGLRRLSADWSIYRAVSSRKWPGDASLEVAHLWCIKGTWNGTFILDDSETSGITAQLTPAGNVSGDPHRLRENSSQGFVGSKNTGMGFILDQSEAESLRLRSSINSEVVLPYLNGDDFNTRPDQSASRWCIFFRSWPLAKCENYTDCISIIRERVKPERDNNPRKGRREKWWLFGEPTPGLYAAIENLSRVLVRSRVGELHSVAFVPTNIVLNERLTIIATSSWSAFAIIQSTIHEMWARNYGATLRTDMMYSHTDCYETFPFPKAASIDQIASLYYEHRKQLMLNRGEGLTKTYSRFHDASENSTEIQRLRELHIELDKAVAACYGWSDIDLGHGYFKVRQNARFTISESARRESLQRLLKLNHERFAEEIKHEASGNKKMAKKSSVKIKETRPRSKQAGMLFDMSEDGKS